MAILRLDFTGRPDFFFMCCFFGKDYGKFAMVSEWLFDIFLIAVQEPSPTTILPFAI